MTRKHVALRAIRITLPLVKVTAWCVVNVVVITIIYTLVQMTPPTQAREEHGQCDVISSR